MSPNTDSEEEEEEYKTSFTFAAASPSPVEDGFGYVTQRQDNTIGRFSSFGVAEEEDKEEGKEDDSIGFTFAAVSPFLFGNDLGHGMEGGKDTMGPFARFLLFLFGFLSSFGIILIATCRSNKIVDTNSRTMVVHNGASDYYINE